MKTLIHFKISILISLSFLVGCAQETKKNDYQKYSETKELMGTFVIVDLCFEDQEDQDIKTAYDEVWARLDEIHWRMSIFDLRSDVNKINDAYARPAKVEADTYWVLEESKRISELTNGTFDLTVWPVIDLWQKAQQKGEPPSSEEIKNVKDLIGMDNIVLMNNHYVQLIKNDVKIDLGGIAKGYAIDEAARILKDNGFRNFLIDAGGDIYVGGENCQRKPWQIGIKDPRDRTKVIDLISIKDTAVATSGDYEQFYVVNGQQWSHIVNPITGYPQKGVVSASVIAPTALEADALATALCVLESKDGLKIVDDLGDGFSALVIKKDNGRIIKRKTKLFKNLSKY